MKLLITLFLFVYSSAWACRDEISRQGQLQVQMGMFQQSQTCFISVHNNGNTKLVYRDFMFTDDGSLMVFNSYGYGSTSEATGAREFYFFPRNRTSFDYSFSQNNPDLGVTFTNGDEILFSSQTASIEKMGKAEIEVDPEVRPDNRGGVEVRNYQGLLLDLGFVMGTAPSYRPKQRAEFRDQKGNKCQLKVADLFRFTEDESFFKFPTDGELAKYLKSRCSGLDLTSLDF